MLFRPTTEADLDRVVAVTVDEPIGWIHADRYLRGARPGNVPARVDLDRRGRRAGGGSSAVVGAVRQRAPGRPGLPVRRRLRRRPRGRGGRAAHRRACGSSRRAGRAQTSAVQPDAAQRLARRPGRRGRPGLAAGGRAGGRADRRGGTAAPGVDARPGVPASSGRLIFADASDEEFLEVFRRIAEGSLDAETRRNLAAKGAEATARDEMDFYLGCPGRREWWRIACAPERRRSRALRSRRRRRTTATSATWASSRSSAATATSTTCSPRSPASTRRTGAELITATTDTGNAPMAAAFDRAGYRNTQIRMIYSAPSD